MAVIVREERIISGKKVTNVKVYRSDRLLTKEAREQAERLDHYLSKKMKEVTEELKKLNLINLKKKRGTVLKLWYELGRRLTFVMDTSIVSPEDRRYVWRALYDHAEDLSPGTPKTRANEGRNHFLYCYKIGLFSWSFVEKAGDWSAWVEFMDSPVIKNDERIIKWLSLKTESAPSARRDWLRRLTKAIRNTFRNMDTTVFTKEELYQKLDKVFEETFETPAGNASA